MYLDFIKDELAAQDAEKQDGRCNIPDGHGGIKRCPCHGANLIYVPSEDKPKTIPVLCEGCQFEEFRYTHATVVLSALDHEDADGEMQTYKIPATKDMTTTDRFLKLREEFIAFVRRQNPKLVPLAELLTLEYTKSEAGRDLDDASSTVASCTDKLKNLALEFLDTIETL